MDKRKLANQQVKDRLLAALVEFAGRKDWSKVTVTELVEQAGVARASFYRNFSSVEELVDYGIRQVTERYHAGKPEGREGFRDRALVEYKFRFYRENAKLVLAFHRAKAATSLLDLDPSPLPHAVAGPLADDGTGTGIGLTRFTGSYSDYLAARAEARQRWERRYRDEQVELSRLRAAVKDQQMVGHSDWRPRSEVRTAKKFYADRNAQVISRRVNDARARLTDLEDRQIRKPPRELEFQGLTVADDPRTVGALEPVLTTVNAALKDRLPATSLSISRGEK
ncbi:MAG: TetR family transcriptional regulator [Cutibacterium avidum]|nr:TetR family transcriptional regulator [Cutibacterium avidum]